MKHSSENNCELQGAGENKGKLTDAGIYRQFTGWRSSDSFCGLRVRRGGDNGHGSPIVIQLSLISADGIENENLWYY